ncbi:alpha/beta hydrolase [Funiculus sociatus GB2-A5]|uniref:Alpha/beta hydrolase n=1 Tax=Funiculus sociatus GB2-A5 TaxID=2933946 RepID=A0ABV0JMW1_9CYAN|nr:MULTISPECIES: alpha/beta hydrolase [unclassified Trichocoleus]MBD1905864.1 alpha/beta hydrolase [Trichocoleus sp. FACHB-832]MBD2065424.1 alpha/beta hydrolase [Trichocoleus sp. FACHB-6]
MSLSVISVPPSQGQQPAGLIVVLHGFGGNAQELASLTPLLNLPSYQFLVPNAPSTHPQMSSGRAWYYFQEQQNGLEQSKTQLTDWLKSLESTTGVPLSRTILMGFSQGGAMTLDVGLNLPLAGLVVLSGYLHPISQPSKQGYPPVLIVHGTKDTVVPLSAAQKARDTLTALGVSVQYHEFNMGHVILPEVLGVVRNFVTTNTQSSLVS